MVALNLKCYALALMSYLITLTLVVIAAAFSGWFNLLTNALSDLGHSARSNVAVIFNFGLAIGSFLLTAFAMIYSLKLSKLMSLLLMMLGFTLNLVAVFDEAYGTLHYIVSVAFFTSIALLILGYAITFNKYLSALTAIAVGASSWLIYFMFRIPKGAAIPELLSILIALPFYMSYSREVCEAIE